MIIALDHLVFGNGHGLGAPCWDSVYYWLDGEMYTFSGGHGAQLHSIQWTHPKPGERRKLVGRDFVAFNSLRRWGRVQVSWSMVNLSQDMDEANQELRRLRKDLHYPHLAPNV